MKAGVSLLAAELLFRESFRGKMSSGNFFTILI